MALSSKLILNYSFLSSNKIISCSFLTPNYPQKQFSKTVNFSHIALKSTFSPQNLTVVADDDDYISIEIERKIRAFKHMLRNVGEDEVLVMIDAIQRLGIEHHFQDEIGSILQRIFDDYHIQTNDLRNLALRFRLLRQEGYYVSSEVFDKLKDKEGKFDERLRYDIEGLMELYEASQLSIKGEDLLDELGDYSYQLLNSWMTRVHHSQAKIVQNTLDHPHHKSLAKFMAQKYLSRDAHMRNNENRWMKELQELATFEFKMVQSKYQEEMLQILRWWKGLFEELKFARNQPLKWYIWSTAAFTNPSLSEQRIDLTKPISFIYIIDDIFDVHGSLDELILFTDVVDRWDVHAAQKLPHYMRLCFNALDNITNEIANKVYKSYGRNPIESLRKTWRSLCKAFLVEARWFSCDKMPSGEEYLQNGTVSSGVHVVLVHVFYLLGQGVTPKAMEFIDNNPTIISSTAAILRLWDDLGSAKDEYQDGNDGSYVECYMKENAGCSVENARKEVNKMISDAWKQLNQECLFQKQFSPNFNKSCLNLARMVPLMYSYDDHRRLPLLEHHIKSVLYGSASI
ncbi:probable terpene synthase 13 [Mercurialis annua]|uniref:probable terpene synthase 13 n=1 Tax=Mercurialis annua TaxID=3986 RepID=UPI002160B0BD|nr:probable terpene synthase 13 [Mercurialis annua]